MYKFTVFNGGVSTHKTVNRIMSSVKVRILQVKYVNIQYLSFKMTLIVCKIVSCCSIVAITLQLLMSYYFSFATLTINKFRA